MTFHLMDPRVSRCSLTSRLLNRTTAPRPVVSGFAWALATITTITTITICAATLQSAAAGESILLSEHGSGRATGYSETNKIITAAGKTHIAWLDSTTNGFEVKIRTLDAHSGKLSPTYHIGDAQDNHGGPALVIDSQGYLHTAYYPHSKPMRYRKSLRPHDASQWGPEIEFGDRLTYPTLMVGPDDTLYLTARRRGESQVKWTLEFYSKPSTGEWSKPTTLMEANEPSYAHFQCALAWGPDNHTLHLTSRMYGDNPRWGYLVGYMKSEDFGKTWRCSDGRELTLPVTKHSLEAVETIGEDQREQYASAGALRGEAIAVDSRNRPHVLYNTLSIDGRRLRQAWIAVPDADGNWVKSSLNEKLDALPDGWGVGMPGGITIGPDDRISVVLTMADDLRDRSFWGAGSSEIVYAESTDGGATFRSQIISPQADRIPSWLPNIEKPTGFNQVPKAPGVIFLLGDKGENNNAIVANRVYFWRGSAGRD